MDNNKIGKFISKLRQEKGLTQKQLGDKLFVTDKAVSKWERGYSLPDITLLNDIAKILDVEVSDILCGEKVDNNKINVEKEFETIKIEYEKKHKKIIKKIMILLFVLLFLLVYLLYKNAKLGYDIKNVYYPHSNRKIDIGIAKFSFMLKSNDRSYSYKNIRNASIIENEIKSYLNTLKYSTCNDTIYYYDEKNNFSIIDYKVKNHIFYSTVSYEIVDYNYCEIDKLYDISGKLGALGGIHSLNGGVVKKDTKWTNLLEIYFLDNIDTSTTPYRFDASMKVRYYKRTRENSYDTYALEDSKGYYEVKGNKLYYYRTEIKDKMDNINIPEVSTFEIKDKKLILIDNYLSDYQKDIVLK